MKELIIGAIILEYLNNIYINYAIHFSHIKSIETLCIVH